MTAEQLQAYLADVQERAHHAALAAARLEALVGVGGEATYDYCKDVVRACASVGQLAGHEPDTLLEAVLTSL